MSRITKKQIIAIRTQAGKRFGDDDQYRDWLWSNFRVKSTKDLTWHQANIAKKLLYQKSNNTPVRSYTSISKAQAERIAILEAVLGWHEDRSRLAGFCEKQTGAVKSIMKYSKKEAQSIIVGMQRIVAPKADDYKKLNSAGNSNLYDVYIDIKSN